MGARRRKTFSMDSYHSAVPFPANASDDASGVEERTAKQKCPLYIPRRVCGTTGPSESVHQKSTRNPPFVGSIWRAVRISGDGSHQGRQVALEKIKKGLRG